MKEPVERIAAFVDDLLHGRRPRRFQASPEELETLQVAAEIRSAQPAADLPTHDDTHEWHLAGSGRCPGSAVRAGLAVFQWSGRGVCRE